jgi:hypothetical protein
MQESVQERMNASKNLLSRKLDGVGWSLFFIWIGLALLVNISWGGTFIGLGFIIICIQMVRKYYNLKIDRFSIAVGLLFVLGGSWELFDIRLTLLPILCIGAGVILLIFSLSSKPGPQY